MNPGPRFQSRTCKKYCKAAEKAVKCEDCEKRFHASCVNHGPVELQKMESGNDSWYCSNCKAECSLCSGAVLNSHKAVQCDKCEMWVHNNCSFMSDSEYETMQNSNCTWICPKCDFFNFSDSFFSMNSLTWKVKIGLTYLQKVMKPSPLQPCLAKKFY